MKEMSLEKMKNVEGEGCSERSAALYGFAAAALITAVGISTGGVGFAVAGGLAAYFGTVNTLYCAMS